MKSVMEKKVCLRDGISLTAVGESKTGSGTDLGAGTSLKP